MAAGVIALAALTVDAAPGYAQDKMSVNRLVNFFEIIAFGSEFEDIGKTPFVRKWKSKSTLTYKIGGNRKSIETFRPVIEKHAKALSFDTGLKFREIGARDPGEHLNLLVRRTGQNGGSRSHDQKNAGAVRKMASTSSR